MAVWSDLLRVFERYPLQSSSKDSQVKLPEFGTAGFRGNPNAILPIACRMAALLAVRCVVARRIHSIAKHTGSACGICITASHNLSSDNGVKLIDIDGEMFPAEWELLASSVSQPDNRHCIQLLQSKLDEYGISEDALSAAVVAIGRDTRPSGGDMREACIEVLNAIGATCVDCGRVTTPEMHFYISRAFTKARIDSMDDFLFTKRNFQLDSPSYVEHLAQHFKLAFSALKSKSTQTFRILIDCANGVAALKLVELQTRLADFIEIHLVNTKTEEPKALNSECGSDWVLQNDMWPSAVNEWIKSSHTNISETLFVSVDGDGDRIVCGVYAHGVLHTLRGDHIQVLFIRFIESFLSAHGQQYSPKVIQTPYANGNSTRYIESELHLPVQMVPTGVKHCQRAAKGANVAVYFESNGHGSILWSKAVLDAVGTSCGGEVLKSLAEISSQTCGDAIGNMLGAVLALSFCQMSLIEWGHLYTELHKASAKVVSSKHIIHRMNSLQTKVEAPVDLQARIDALVSNTVQSGEYPDGSLRYFVRPSGTEPAVRVYVESDFRELSAKVVSVIECFLLEYVNCCASE